MKAEGWYRDPYGLHEERWFSDGTATSLVRDARVESKDPPPHAPAIGEPVRKEVEPLPNGPDDLRRADDAEQGDRGPNYADAAFDNFGVVQSVWDPYAGHD